MFRQEDQEDKAYESDYVLDAMQQLDYPIDPLGVCQGLAMMAEMARSKGEYIQFFKRMRQLKWLHEQSNLLDIPYHLAKSIQLAELHDKIIRYRDIDNTSAPATGEFTAEELQRLANSPNMVNKLNQPNDNKENNKNQSQVSPLDEKAYLLDGRTSFSGELDPMEKRLLEVKSFLYQVWVNFNPNAARSFLGYSGPHLNQRNSQKLNESAYGGLNPDTIDMKSSSFLSPNQYLLFNNGFGEIYLKLFLEAVEANQSSLDDSSASVGLTLTSGAHVVHLFYADNSWHLTDHSLLSSPSTTDDLISKLTSTFGHGQVNNLPHLNASLFGENPSAELIEKLKNIGHESLVTVCKQKIESMDNTGFTPLSAAVFSGQVDALKDLIANNANTNASSGKQITPLVIAVQQGNVECVNLLLGQPGANVSITTALFSAAYNGHVECLDALLKHGVDASIPINSSMKDLVLAVEFDPDANARLQEFLKTNPPDADQKVRITAYDIAKIFNHTVIMNKLQESTLAGKPAKVVEVSHDSPESKSSSKAEEDAWVPHHLLKYAVLNGDMNVINAFLGQPNLKDPDVVIGRDGRTPLYMAVQGEQMDVIRAFLGHPNIDLNKAGPHGLTPFQLAVHRGHLAIVYEFLQQKTNNPGVPGPDIQALLHQAVRLGREQIVEAFLDSSSIKDPNKAGPDGLTPLELAVKRGHGEVVKVLVNHRKMSNPKPIPDWQALLRQATELGHAEVVKALIESAHINDFNKAGPDGLTLLHRAAKNGHVDVVNVFLDKMNPKQALPDNQWTVLHYAAQRGQAEVVKAFLDHPTTRDANNKGPSGLTPLHQAAQLGHAQVVDAFLEHKISNPNEVGADGLTPFHLAVLNGQEDVVKVFLDHEIKDLNKPGPAGKTAMDLAVMLGHKDIANLLAGANEVKMHVSQSGPMAETKNKSSLTPLQSGSMFSASASASTPTSQPNQNVGKAVSPSNKPKN